MTNLNIRNFLSQLKAEKKGPAKQEKSSISENTKSLKSEHAPTANLLLNLGLRYDDIIQIKVYFIIV